MISKDAIDALDLTVAEALRAQDESLHNPPPTGLIPRHQHYTFFDLEPYMPAPRRMRAKVSTGDLTSFCAYLREQVVQPIETKPYIPIFVDADSMSATCVLDYGTADRPGHGDHNVVFQPEQTAAYKGLLELTEKNQSQRSFAEWCEDWYDAIVALDGDWIEIPNPTAITAIRKITIEAAGRVQSIEGPMQASRSAFDEVAVTASGGAKVPSIIRLNAAPYAGLSERAMELRVSVLTGDKAPMFSLRLRQAEALRQELARELVTLIQRQFLPENVHVIVGRAALR